MRDIIIGDIHLDVKSGDLNYLKYQHMFFEQVFNYLDNNEVRYIIFLGDIFTNKKILNVDIMDQSLKLLERFSTYDVQIIMINGNHVIYHKNTYRLDSVDVVFRNRDNLKHIHFKDYLVIDNYAFFNWRNTKEEYIDLFNNLKDIDNIEYVFGHFDLYGFMHTRFAENKNVSSLTKNNLIDSFPSLKKVISGHYHMPQEDSKIFYPGTPYQLSWSEAGLKLGFYILEDGKFDFVKNDLNMYEVIEITSQQDLDSYDISHLGYNQYFKIIFNDKKLEDGIDKLRSELTKIGHNVTIINNFELFDGDIDDVDLELKETNSTLNNSELNLDGIIKDYIYNMNIEDDERDEFYDAFINVYNITKSELTQNFEI